MTIWERHQLLHMLADLPDSDSVSNPAVWRSVQQQAPMHGLGPILASLARPHTAGADRRWCDEQLAQSWRRHLRALDHLDCAIDILHLAGIQAIPLKGPSLACRHYDPPFLRKPPLDLDIAIRDPDIEPACAALAAAGYSLESPIAEARSSSHHVTLLHKSRCRIEAHFQLYSGAGSIPLEDVFSRALPYNLPSGRATLRLDPADELLHLTLHLAGHRFANLFHFYELHRLWTASSTEERQQAVSRAIAHGHTGAIALTDIGFRLHWNEPFIPAGMTLPRTWLHWRLNEKLFRTCENWLTPGRGLSARLSGRIIDLQMTDTPADGARWFALALRVAWVRFKRGEWGVTLR